MFTQLRIINDKLNKMDEQKLRQLFKNRSNCYADADDVVQAMDENCFVETVREFLHIYDVVGRSEQLSCGRNITTCVFYKDGGKCSNPEYCRDQTT